MIKFDNVSYTYFSGFYTLFNFSYNFDAGNYALVGDDVGGPLTLIRLLAKLDTYYKGNILINGKSLKKTNYKKDFQVAYISAKPKFFNNKTVLENVAYPLKSRGVKKVERNNIALVTLSNWGWKDKANLKVKDLNHSDLITLALIRASVRKLDLLLCENIFDTISPSVLDKINATTKIIVTPDYSNFNNYTALLFNLGNLDD
ncbi:MAG: ATP-binding cassette domain-containing protein [Clostridia bacterium]|nr:ATP-binding cassette domain-containing protein [Clostridia bacterium]